MTHRICPQFHDQNNLLLAGKGMDYISARADAVINVSGSTQKDLLEEFPHLESKSQIIYEAANADLFKVQDNPIKWAEIKLRYGLDDYPYFISLSTIEPRKNLKNIIEGFFLLASQNTASDVRLVICGRKGWKHEQLYGDNHPFANRIHFTGHVLDEDLPWLYSKAIALCYIPHYEGFGLPPLEAMCCRTPVLYGNNSALPEIAGEAGLPVDQNDTTDIANQMSRLLEDTNLRDQLAAKAFIRSRHFSWLKTAFQTLNVYEQTISNSRVAINQAEQPFKTPEAR
jgi:glycosyltransferase involved in cell wall biosynthesis